MPIYTSNNYMGFNVNDTLINVNLLGQAKTRVVNSFIRTHIDRFYTSQSITPYLFESSIAAYSHPDHDLVLLTLDPDHQPRGPGYWHLNNTLLDEAIFNTEIREFWTLWFTEKSNFPTTLEWWESTRQNFKCIAIKCCTRLQTGTNGIL